MKVGILTGGGDAPGLNGVIESATRTLCNQGHTVIGIHDGFEGVFEGKVEKLNIAKVTGIHASAGTILGTSNRCGTKGREEEFLKKFKELEVDGLIVAGGDGTFAGLMPFKDKIPFVGVPKTIDNDLSGTELTFGHDTACTVVADAVESLKATANGHRRILVVEAMGRNSGWIALNGGLAGYADAILIPERPFDGNKLSEFLNHKKTNGQRGMIIVVAEGAFMQGESIKVKKKVENSPETIRLGGIAQWLSNFIEEKCNIESRHVVLGHLQRSHRPTNMDRLLSMGLGHESAKLVHNQQWHLGLSIKKNEIKTCPITDFMNPPRIIPKEAKQIILAQGLDIFI